MVCGAPLPHSAERLAFWAERSLATGALNDASDCVEAALSLSPNFGHAHYLRGGVKVLAGQAAAAVPDFRRALRTDPAHADAYFECAPALHRVPRYRL